MGEMLRVDVDALRVMAAGVRVQADVIGGIDPVDLIAEVGRAMPDSAIGVAAAGVAEPLVDTLRQLADRLRHMSDVAERGTRTYEEADAALAGEMEKYLRGLP